MSLLFYASPSEKSVSRLEKALNVYLEIEEAVFYRSRESFFERCGEFGNAPEIAVLQAADRRELLSFLSLRDYLKDVRLVLILPDMEAETLALAHRLRPRVLMGKSADFTEVRAVLDKMLGRFEGARTGC